MAPKRLKLNAEVQPPAEVPVDPSGNPLPPQFNRPPPSLVTLPDEVQLMIYRYLLPSKRTFRPKKPGNPERNHRQRSTWGKDQERAILGACRSTHRLTASVFFSENKFYFETTTDIEHFFTEWRSYRRFIQHLILGDYSGSSESSEVTLDASRIQELHTLPSLKTLEFKRTDEDDRAYMHVTEARQDAQEKLSRIDFGLLLSKRPALAVTVSAEWRNGYRLSRLDPCTHKVGRRRLTWDVTYDQATNTATMGPERMHCSMCSRSEWDLADLEIQGGWRLPMR